MTTIVYKNGIIAADTQETLNGTARRCQKLYKHAGVIIATAGDSYTGMMFVEWWKAGKVLADIPDLTSVDMEEDFECLVWDNGKLWSVNRFFTLVRINLDDHPYYALGSGADVALGALAMGASAKRAVEVAAEFDVSTGLPVQAWTCPDTDRGKKR